jgi:hypothetical protein
MLSGKNCFTAATAVLLLFSSIMPSAAGPQQKNNERRILWSFCAIRSDSNPPKAEPVLPRMVLSSGDKLKVMIQAKNKCFVYLIHKDSQGNFTMLFPYSVKQFDTEYQIGHSYYAPKGEPWFQLDGNTGIETFYLLASDQRLLDIEYTYDKYASSEASTKENLARQMLAALDRFTENRLASAGEVKGLPGKRVVQRGFERANGGDPTDITAMAREISFDSVYSETFVVEHK